MSAVPQFRQLSDPASFFSLSENDGLTASKIIQVAIAGAIRQSDNPLEIIENLGDTPQMLKCSSVRAAIESSISTIAGEIANSEDIETIQSYLIVLDTALDDETMSLVLTESIVLSNNPSNIFKAIQDYNEAVAKLVKKTTKKKKSV